MPIYLVQHGKSLSKELDGEKGLSPEGRADVERIAQVARGYGVPVARIKHSGKKRARETAEIFGAVLGLQGGIQASDGLNPLDDVTSVAPDLRSSDNLMLVGHLPFMEKLVSQLIIGSADCKVFRFQNGGIVCVEQEPETGLWMITWSLMPSIGKEWT
ncbi:MAG: phosphohistidine phosphatase SixA [bacterium]|nr:phosphohistidine phosphatase SixA [bacterium]